MLKNESQYDYVKEILLKRMSKYNRNSFQLERLYTIIHDQTQADAYIQFSYKEFYDMFVKECVNGNIPNHKFSIASEGFLDKKKKYPFANIRVDYIPRSLRKKNLPKSTLNSGTRS